MSLGAPTGPATTAAGGPNRRLRAVLTWRDALAWEQLPSELRGWRKAGFFALPVLAGAGWAAFGERRPGWLQTLPDWGVMLVLALLSWLVWVVLANLSARRRARRRIPRPLPVLAEDWGDHLYLQIGPDEDVMLPETTLQTVLGPAHLFLQDADRLLILPLRAFDDAAEMAAFAEVWRDRGRDPEG